MIVKPAVVTGSTIGRVRWQPPNARFCSGSMAPLPAAHSVVCLGASPCSTKSKRPPRALGGKMPSGASPRSTRSRRLIKAPRDRVYDALTDAEAVSRWKVPAGLTCQVHEFDAREGGALWISLTYRRDHQLLVVGIFKVRRDALCGA